MKKYNYIGYVIYEKKYFSVLINQEFDDDNYEFCTLLYYCDTTKQYLSPEELLNKNKKNSKEILEFLCMTQTIHYIIDCFLSNPYLSHLDLDKIKNKK